jgi:hypothetical protein
MQAMCSSASVCGIGQCSADLLRTDRRRIGGVISAVRKRSSRATSARYGTSAAGSNASTKSARPSP